MGKPSYDRVHFRLPDRTKGRRECKRAAQAAFDIDEETAEKLMVEQTEIIVRPSQFARFMIYRDEFGGQNSFKEMGAVLKPAVNIEVQDLSVNNHRPSVYENVKRSR